MQSQQTFQNRRYSFRFSYGAPVRVMLDGDPELDFLLTCADISEGGAFLETNLLFAVGDRLTLEVASANGLLTGQGRVVRAGSENGRTGVAVALG
jgi:hypothetical protein